MAQFPENLNGRTVILGLSGGVDSAVAAILLQYAGARVQALHMTNWEDDDGYCTAAADLQDARRIAERLDLPLHHVNFAREYRERVFADFLAEYQAGRTPNPDVLCNREIKFGEFLRYAQRLGGELIATGHYARTADTDGGIALLKGVDPGKDQSYFLHAVPGDALQHAVFPLGAYTKTEIREIARDHGLPVHDKKDSTGICFIGERPFREFLAGFLPAKPGPIEAADGRILGRHDGLMYYTPGQRQGLGIGGRKDAGEAPWYVVAKDSARNALIVDQGDSALLYSDRLRTSPPHWVGSAPAGLAGGIHLSVKVRYRQPEQECFVVGGDDDGLEVHFSVPQRAVAPGQFAVFYAGEQCLGGGVIESAWNTAATHPEPAAAV
jgi:tRNA-specific 2-thiouridylase